MKLNDNKKLNVFLQHLIINFNYINKSEDLYILNFKN
jgi:hypothetical protein